MSGARNRHCICSRADSMNDRGRAVCHLHGNTDVSRAYRAGVADALSGAATEVPKQASRIVGEEEAAAPLREAVEQAVQDERARLSWWLRAGLSGPAAPATSPDYLSAIADLADVIEQHPERWAGAPTTVGRSERAS